eukprot:CAMPEP_0172909354 /NCGR_PEP_ID=MMETSP1075-20121228/182520_1 /TAXON_ID=2916 /ORGANISM="Ceratium fusus, Strain PA161109" /LENGTH=151 /DNA_ID=CAMNT_0013767281 /DNA_START=359 /DNA_END=814 /DNA_ORIENTATION=+
MANAASRNSDEGSCCSLRQAHKIGVTCRAEKTRALLADALINISTSSKGAPCIGARITAQAQRLRARSSGLKKLVLRTAAADHSFQPSSQSRSLNRPNAQRLLAISTGLKAPALPFTSSCLTTGRTSCPACSAPRRERCNAAYAQSTFARF